jgi:tricorn protease-like protein
VLSSLDNLRKAARRRLHDLRTSNPSATLREAQHALAREHGHESWLAMLASIAAERQRIGASVLQLSLQTDELTVCAFTPDRRRALTAAQDHPVQLWNLQTGTCVRVFDQHTRPVWALEWHSDAHHFVSGSFDGTLRLWEVDSGRVRRVFDGGRPIRTAAWSPNERFVATGSVHLGSRSRAADSQFDVDVWDVETGRVVQKFSGHTYDVYSVQWSPDQQRMLTASRDATVRVWDVDDGRCLRVLGGHTNRLHAAAWAPDGVRAASAGDAVRVWNLDTGECEAVFTGHSDTIRTVRWSRDERRLLSASHDGNICVWDVATRQPLRTLTGHSAGVINAVWDLDERQLYSCDWRGEIRVWDDR